MISRRRRASLALTAFLLLAVGAALAHVTVRLGVIRLGYAITEATHARQELEEQNRRLRVELALLGSPERIERLARDKLGMTRPDPAEVRLISPATSATAALADQGGRAP